MSHITPRSVTLRATDGIYRFFEPNGVSVPLNRAGYKTASGAYAALRRFYAIGLVSLDSENAQIVELLDMAHPDRETPAREADFVSRMIDHDIEMDKALAAPPAAPVASDPVPADVPCYLAVSTDGAGVETVLGVFRVADHASPQEAEAEASKLCDRIRAAAPLASYGTRWSNGKPEEPRVIEAATRAEFDTACGAAVAEHGREAPKHSCKGGVMEMRWPHVIVRWRFEPPAMVPLGGRYVALADGGVEWVADAPTMVPQPCQPQQARARGRTPQPARGERRYVTVRDTETGDVHRVLTSVARVGVAVVIFTPSNRHRQGALGGMLITHDDIRKAWVFNDEAEARRMLSRNRAPGERVIRAEIVSDPAVA